MDSFVYMDDTSAAVMIDIPAESVVMGDAAASVAIEIPTETIYMGDAQGLVVCDDVIASSFTTPTLTAWHANAVDNGSAGCEVAFTATTAGSPCRVMFHLVDAVTWKTPYSSPEQNTPHATSQTIAGAANRDKSYDLKWSWTSGSQSVTQELVLADAVFIPASGAGDHISEG